jgi:hypothetical protein
MLLRIVKYLTFNKGSLVESEVLAVHLDSTRTQEATDAVRFATDWFGARMRHDISGRWPGDSWFRFLVCLRCPCKMVGSLPKNLWRSRRVPANRIERRAHGNQSRSGGYRGFPAMSAISAGWGETIRSLDRHTASWRSPRPSALAPSAPNTDARPTPSLAAISRSPTPALEPDIFSGLSPCNRHAAPVTL